jgi:hypothetical protein
LLCASKALWVCIALNRLPLTSEVLFIVKEQVPLPFVLILSKQQILCFWISSGECTWAKTSSFMFSNVRHFVFVNGYVQFWLNLSVQFTLYSNQFFDL